VYVCEAVGRSDGFMNRDARDKLLTLQKQRTLTLERVRATRGYRRLSECGLQFNYNVVEKSTVRSMMKMEEALLLLK
jgi:hypothetical protein